MKKVNKLPKSGDFTIDSYPPSKKYPKGLVEIWVPSLWDIIKNRFCYIFKIGWKRYKVIYNCETKVTGDLEGQFVVKDIDGHRRLVSKVTDIRKE